MQDKKFKQNDFLWNLKIPIGKMVCLNFGFFDGKCKVVSAVSKKVVSFEKSGIALEKSGIV
jgi:hypothetical protein